MDYYYFAASLPALSMEHPPAITSEEFRALCEEHLSERDRRALDDLFTPLEMPSRHPFVSAWKQHETQLRNTLASLRAAASGREAKDFLREEGERFVTEALHVASEALAKQNPLEKERTLDLYRWEQIEDLEGFNMFSGNTILAYGLKLQIVERWARMDDGVGSERSEALVQMRPDAAE
jgi:hypothetical protein